MKGLAEGLCRRFQRRWAESPGQSIVEMALFFPIVLAIMVSVMEVGNALNAFITVENAAREGARFGAAGGTTGGISQVVTDTLDLRLDIAGNDTDVFVIRGTTSSDGATMANWEETHAFGSAPPATSGVTSDEVLDDLQSQGITNTASMEFVAAVAHYDLKSLLGVPLVSNLSEMIPLSAYSVMPVQSLAAPESSVGCDIYPIGVSKEIIDNLLGGDKYFKFQNVTPGDADHFAWFDWDCHVDPCPLHLAEGLSHPTLDPNFNRALLDIHVGDWLPGYEMDLQLAHGGAGCGEEADWDELERVMIDHVDTGRTILIVVFDHTATIDGSPCNQYLVVGFITARILSYNIESFEGHPDRFHTVQFEYVGDYTACGQPY